MSEYTKGPWYWAALRDSNLYHFLMSPHAEPPNETVGPVIMDAGVYGPLEPDAHLIATAPDLLEALEGLWDVVDGAIQSGDWQVDGACDPAAALHRAERAIKKARGEQ